jgi:hypothetical protein
MQLYSVQEEAAMSDILAEADADADADAARRAGLAARRSKRLVTAHLDPQDGEDAAGVVLVDDY